MKGHIRERSPGHWAIVVDIRDPATGRRHRKWHAFAGTKRKAQEECAQLISALKGGTYLEPAKITVAGHMDRWLEHARPQVSPKTFERYCGVVRGNIVPALGTVLLTKLQPAQIADSDEVGHAFQSEAGHCSELMPAGDSDAKSATWSIARAGRLG